MKLFSILCGFFPVILLFLSYASAQGNNFICPSDRRVQIVFVQDRTSTLKKFIREFAQASTSIVHAVQRDFPHAEFGYTAFADFDVKLKKHYPYKDPHKVQSRTSCYESIQPLTNDEDKFRNTVTKFSDVPPVNGAYDPPESSMTAILYSVSDHHIKWERSGNPTVKKIVILITDEDTVGPKDAPKLTHKPKPTGNGHDNCLDFSYPDVKAVGDIMYERNFSIIGLLAPNSRKVDGWHDIDIVKTWKKHFWTLGIPHHIELMKDPEVAAQNIANTISNSVRLIACSQPQKNQGQEIRYTPAPPPEIYAVNGPPGQPRPRPPPRKPENQIQDPSMNTTEKKVQIVFLLDRTQKFSLFTKRFAEKAKNFVSLMKKLFSKVEFGITAFADFPISLKKGGKKDKKDKKKYGFDVDPSVRCYERILPLTNQGKKFLHKLKEFAQMKWVNSFDPPDSSMTGLLYTAADKEMLWNKTGDSNVHKIIIMITNEDTVSKKDAPNLVKFPKPVGDGEDTCTDHSFPDMKTVKKVLKKGNFEVVGMIAPNMGRTNGWSRINTVTLWNKYFLQIGVDYHIEQLSDTNGLGKIVFKMIRGVLALVLNETVDQEEERPPKKKQKSKGNKDSDDQPTKKKNHKKDDVDQQPKKKQNDGKPSKNEDEGDRECDEENAPDRKSRTKGSSFIMNIFGSKFIDFDYEDEDSENSVQTQTFGKKSESRTQNSEDFSSNNSVKKSKSKIEEEDKNVKVDTRKGNKCNSKKESGEVDLEIEIPKISKLQMVFVIERGRAYKTFLSRFVEGIVKLIGQVRKKFTLAEFGFAAFDDFDSAIKQGKSSTNPKKDISCYELIQPLTQSDLKIYKKLEKFLNTDWDNVAPDPPSSSLTALMYAAADSKMKWDTTNDPNTKKLIVLVTNEEPVDELDAPGLVDKLKPTGDGLDTCTNHSYADPETAATVLSEGSFGVIALIGPSKRESSKVWPKWPPIDSWAVWDRLLSSMGIEYIISPIPIDIGEQDDISDLGNDSGERVEKRVSIRYEYVEWFEQLTHQSIDALTLPPIASETETTDVTNVEECSSVTKIQIVFVQDKSATFSYFIREFALMSYVITNGILKQFPVVEFGITAFSDFHPELKNGSKSDVQINKETSCYQRILPLTSDVKTFISKLNEFAKVPEIDGGEGGQSSITALLYSANDPKMKWDKPASRGVKKIMILVTNEDTVNAKDAPSLEGKPKPLGNGHDTCTKHSFPDIDDTGQILQSQEFDVIGILPQNNKNNTQKLDIVTTWDHLFSRLGINYHIEALETSHVPGGITDKLIGGIKVVSCQSAELASIE